MANNNVVEKHLKTLLSPQQPMSTRVNVMVSLAAYDVDLARHVFSTVLSRAQSSAEGQSEELEQLKAIFKEIEQGPMRIGTYVAADHPLRAQIMLQDGTITILPVIDPAINKDCGCGDEVLVEATGKAIISRYNSGSVSGEEAVLLRRVSDRWVEVATRDGTDKAVYLASNKLIKKLDEGAVPKGSTILVCSRRMLALDFVAPPEGRDKFMFVCREPVPDVVISRDIGNPPEFLFKMIKHVHREMINPEVARTYRLNRSITRMLVGPSGTGKTLCLQGFIREVYELMSKITGAPIDKLPHRMLRLRCSQVLSQWLGQSDKMLDRFFDEAEALASEQFEWNGKKYDLPVLVIFEEAESLGRRRGGDADGIYDRIQTTLLQRLDNTYDALRDNLIVYLFTSNLHTAIDPAFLRRAGGQVEYFDRLEERGFCEVLRKQLRDRKISRSVSGSGDEKIESIVEEVKNHLYNGDKGEVEVIFSSGNREIKHKRDFLTGGLINRAVLQASETACENEINGDGKGLTGEMVLNAHLSQLATLIDSLDQHNADSYITAPQGVRIVNVRKV